jgi:hypothetical protein
MHSKKAQASLISFWKVFVAGALFIPFINIYDGFKDHLFSTITNPFILFLIVILPVMYWVGVLFLFVNTIRGVIQ